MTSNRLTRWQRFASRYPLALIALTIVGLSTAYLIVSIGLDYWSFHTSAYGRYSDFGLYGWSIRERIVEVLVFWWVVAFGASVGSFLNVVVYRMPLGMSLSAKSSHCVWCKAKIRSSDNLPIIGWIRLRGRCRKCRLPISGRYPLVEAITGILGLIAFVAMVQIQNFGLGPFSQLPVHWHYWLMHTAPVGQLVLYFYYFWVLAFLISVAWMDWDGNSVPWKLFVTSCLSALLIPASILFVAKPYFQMQLMSDLDLRFASDWGVDWLQRVLAFDVFGTIGSTRRTAVSLVAYQCMGGLAGCLSAIGLSTVFYSAFPNKDASWLQEDAKAECDIDPCPPERLKPAGHQWLTGLLIFFVVGLFMGPVFVVLLAISHFLVSVLMIPIFMNGRLSPLRHRWFLLPYSFTVAIFFWRWCESLMGS